MYVLWFNFILGLNFIFFCFKLIIIHYHTQKQKKIKFKPTIKLNHNICIQKKKICYICFQQTNISLTSKNGRTGKQHPFHFLCRWYSLSRSYASCCWVYRNKLLFLKYYRHSLTLTPYPTPSLFFCFCSHLFASYVSLTKRLQQIRVFREFWSRWLSCQSKGPVQRYFIQKMPSIKKCQVG